MYVCTFSTLTVTINPPTSKTHVCVLGTFFVSSNPPFSNVCLTKVTKRCCLRPLVFPEAESSPHFTIGGRRSFLRVFAINLKSFDVIAYRKLSLDDNFLFVLLLAYKLQTRITWLILTVLIIDLSRKKSTIDWNKPLQE